MASDMVDDLSSPDPLGLSIDSTTGGAWSTRRITRSQRSTRFISLGSVSPRKQTFELEVGDAKSPKKLFVTVEAEEPEEDNNGASVARKLFTTATTPTPVIRRRERTTTTTVPLRTSEAEQTAAAGTPRRRGRPPKSAAASGGSTPNSRSATPSRSSTSRKRAGTPIKRTPGQTRKAKRAADVDGTPSEAAAGAKPTPRPRGRPRKNATPAPPSETEAPSSRSTATRATRKRRTALMPQEAVDLADADVPMADVEIVAPIEEAAADSSDNVIEYAENAVSTAVSEAAAESEADIWMATLSDAPTPRASTRRYRTASSANSVQLVEMPRATPSVSGSEAEAYEAEGFASHDAQSDIQSELSEAPKDTTARIHDTIVESEEFSMIFMDSIPSLRQGNSSTHVPHEELGEETNMIINQTLESLRQGGHDDDLAAPAETTDTTRASLPALPPPQQSPSPMRNSAAPSPETRTSPFGRSPRRIKPLPLSRQLLAFKARQMEDDPFSGDASKSRDAGSPGRRSPQRDPARFGKDDSVMYEDSFSEIPDAVLEAATPRRPQTRNMSAESAAQSSPRSTGGSISATNLMSEPGRLPTPEETPSPSDAQGQNSNDKDVATEEDATLTIQKSFAASMQSSLHPQESSQHSATLRENVTPINLPSSPQVPEHGNMGLLAPPRLEADRAASAQRPALSPIIRVGQALQSVTSDNSPPAARQSTLGSPFKGSVGSASARSTMTWSLPDAHASQPRVVLFPRQQQELPQPQPLREPSPEPVVTDDPFTAETAPVQSSGQPGFVRALAQSVFSSVARSIPGLRSSASNAAKNAAPVADVDEMSWVADSPSRTAVDRRISLDRSRNFASSQMAAPATTARPIVDDDAPVRLGFDAPGDLPETDDADSAGELEQDDDDIWAVEAQRRTPRTTRQQPFGRRAPASVGRRGKAASPQKKATVKQPTVPTMVLRESTNRASNRMDEPSQLDEYSMVSQPKSNYVSQKPSEAIAQQMRKVDLSGFFSSPAPLPGMQSMTKVQDALRRSIVQPQPEIHQEPLQVFHMSSMFPSIPQKEFQPTPQKSRGHLFSSAPSTQPAEPSTTKTQSLADSPDENASFPSVAQKQNFTPRQRQTGGTLLFGARPGSAGSRTAPTPPRMMLTKEDIERWQDESATADEDSFMGGAERENEGPSRDESLGGFAVPFLRPLPDRNVSPTKSCLRSPLKPKTPGRVVEFTSSVLSPLAQARAQAQAQSPGSEAGSATERSRSSAQRAGSLVFDDPEEDKENRGTNASISASGLPLFLKGGNGNAASKANTKAAEPLSQTVWSRNHWLLLEQLISLRRRGPFAFDVAEQGGFKRGSAPLLGRTVVARGRAMELEQWHLDVVDGFRAEVGGWAEEVLAKRAFSLLVCEAARKEGRIEELKMGVRML